jgi:hypothetical protein
MAAGALFLLGRGVAGGVRRRGRHFWSLSLFFFFFFLFLPFSLPDSCSEMLNDDDADDDDGVYVCKPGEAGSASGSS